MAGLKDLTSFFTGKKEEACDVSASKMFDANAHKMVTLMRHAGDDADTIAAAVTERKAEYVANVCAKPSGPAKP